MERSVTTEGTDEVRCVAHAFSLRSEFTRCKETEVMVASICSGGAGAGLHIVSISPESVRVTAESLIQKEPSLRIEPSSLSQDPLLPGHRFSKIHHRKASQHHRAILQSLITSGFNREFSPSALTSDGVTGPVSVSLYFL